jgi:polysaccharide export outer membrane protein
MSPYWITVGPSIRNYGLLIGVLFMLNACISPKDVVYFQDNDDPVLDTIPESQIGDPVIQKNDLLAIYVSSINVEASRFFNPANAESADQESDRTSYLVDSEGMIEMPLIGKVEVGGLTTKQMSNKIRGLLEKYLESPTVRVYLESFKVTILGEVKVPGVYYIRNEKVTLPEALGLAGDMTIYGERKQVQVIREGDGQRIFINTDMTKREVFSSPGYNLKPNDIVYVPAGKGRVASADVFYRIAPLVISTLTLITLINIRF